MGPIVFSGKSNRSGAITRHTHSIFETMKKREKIICLICLIIAACACNRDQTQTTMYEQDGSLAGSISFAGYEMEAECSYDNGDSIEKFQYDDGHLTIAKVSDNEIELFCFSRFDRGTIKISIPKVTVSGNPYDAIFDFSCDDAAATYDNDEFAPIHATVRGWIKSDRTREVSGAGRSSDPAMLGYTCAIDIQCRLNDGVLDLKILSVRP